MSSIPSSQGPKAEYTLLAEDTYPARLVEFVGLGMQEQKAYEGKAKAPCFKGIFGFEIAGEVITVTKGDEVTEIPAIMRPQYNIFPNGERGKTFDLCVALEAGTKKVPADLDFFKSAIGSAVAVTVGTYVDGKGITRNCVNGVAPMMRGMSVAEVSVDTVFFDPYDGSEEMKSVYDNLFEYIREWLGTAVDAEHIPFAGMEAAASEASGEAEENEEDVY